MRQPVHLPQTHSLVQLRLSKPLWQGNFVQAGSPAEGKLFFCITLTLRWIRYCLSSWSQQENRKLTLGRRCVLWLIWNAAVLTFDLDQTCTDPVENRYSTINCRNMASTLPGHIFELSSGVYIDKHVPVFTDGLYFGTENQQLMSLSYRSFNWKPIYQSHDFIKITG